MRFISVNVFIMALLLLLNASYDDEAIHRDYAKVKESS